MLTGYVNVYISRKETVSTASHDEFYSLESESTRHKFIQIEPHKYNIKGSSEWFILIQNPKIDEAGFTLSISKSNSKGPIEPGITKILNLGPGDVQQYFYEPASNENSFEIKLELTEVVDPNYKDQALSLLYNFVSLYVLKGEHDDKKTTLQSNSVEVHENFAHIKFSVPFNYNQKLGVRVFNPVGRSGLSLKVDLFAGGYKLVSMTEPAIGMVRNNEVLTYEAYTNLDKYLFVSVKQCMGLPKLTFYENDYTNLEKGEALKAKEIKDENSFIQYAKLSSQRAFIKVQNLKDSLSVFKLEVFNESDMDTNPFGELIQEGDGQVEIDTSAQTIKLKPLKIMKAPNEEFFIEVKYTVYLANDIKVMRYAKNCGKYLINMVFDNHPELIVATERVRLERDQVMLNKRKNRTALQNFLRSGFIEIKVEGLQKNQKYYGIVVAELSIFPKNESVLSPIRTGKAYYDEFTVISARVQLPIKLIISCFIILAILTVLFIIIKAYIFGGVSKLHQLANTNQIDSEFEIETSDGLNALTMLEQAYYEEKRRVESDRKLTAAHPKSNNQSKDNLTETHCQEVEMQESSQDGDRIDIAI
jgi:hypothetical protein